MLNKREENVIIVLHFRACLKKKIPANCDVHFAECLFQIRFRKWSDLYMTLEEILAQVQMGGLSPEAAGKLIRQDGYKEMDYAKLDTGRKARTGFAEVIYCSNKADAHLLKIFERLYMEEGEVLGTRASQE